MKHYRVFYIKNGMKLTKIVHAISVSEVREVFKDYIILLVVETK